MQPRLLIVSGPRRGWVVYLDAEEVTVGRHGSNCVVIPDPSVSRRHFSVVRDGRLFRLRDCGSRNGTFVDGRAVAEHTLKEGDTIRTGGSFFVFLLRGEGEAFESDAGTMYLVDRAWARDRAGLAM